MSEALRNKLNQFESTPPPEVWHKIANELDEALPYNKMADRLNSYEVTPPAEIWNNIEFTLDEILPYKNTQERLSTYEVIPPAGIFQNIATALENDTPKKLTPVRGFTPAYKMLAAAVILAIATSAVWLLNQKSQNEPIASTNKFDSSDIGAASKIADSNTNQAITGKELKSLIKHAPIDKQSSIATLSGPNSNVGSSNSNLVSSRVKVKLNPPHVKESISDLAAKFVVNSNYITVLGADGGLQKMSTKIFKAAYSYDLTDSEASEGHVHHSDLIENYMWKGIFKEWRDKIIQSGLAPNSINGVDILDLKDLIQKN